MVYGKCFIWGGNYAAQCISVKMAQEDVFEARRSLYKDAEDTDFIRYSGSTFHTI